MENMKEIIQELIRNFHSRGLPLLVKRNIKLFELPKNVRKAFVFIGMRRSGKTWTLYQIMQELIAKGIDLTKMLYLNFEDDRLGGMRRENFQDILKAYFELYPQYLNRQDIFFFFDEIHEVELWEKFIRRLLDQEQMQIYLTGSSCKLLSKEIASTLRGRTLAKEIFPFSFQEYLKTIKFEIPKLMGTNAKIEILHNLQNYLKWGGFPEVIGASPETHRQLLQEYISSVIYRDIVDRYKISNSNLLRQLLTHSLKNSSRIFSIGKIYNDFKSLGHVVGKNTLYEYMSYFEDAYCLFSVCKYDISYRKSEHSIKKVFAVDQGLITAVSVESDFDLSMQLETAVFAHFRRQTSSIFYYRTADGKEVDFLVIMPDNSKFLAQVCLSLREHNTKKRELDALIIAMKELKLKQGLIITLEEEEIIEMDGKKIYVVPAFKYFLANFKFID